MECPAQTEVLIKRQWFESVAEAAAFAGHVKLFPVMRAHREGSAVTVYAFNELVAETVRGMLQEMEVGE